jgi:hypothetical protein
MKKTIKLFLWDIKNSTEIKNAATKKTNTGKVIAPRRGSNSCRVD